jgi:hypothetical protein
MWEYISKLTNAHQKWPDGVQATLISGYRHVAERCNHQKLDLINEPLMSYSALDSITTMSPDNWHMFKDDEAIINREFKSYLPQLNLKLKLGAKVILIKNISPKKGLVNGSLGTIIGFEKFEDMLLGKSMLLPVVKFVGVPKTYVIGYSEFTTNNGEEMTYRRVQIPLKLGYALTVHKSQGMTLDRVILDLPLAFAPGHGTLF